jgi:hypothetical protein
LIIFKKNSKITDIMSMEGLTTREIGEKLGITPEAAYLRLRTAKIKPKARAGNTALYDKSVVDKIRNPSKGGRPRKKP